MHALLMQDIPLNIIHEDHHLMVINKPAGMVVHPSPGHMESGTLVNALLYHWQQPAVVAELSIHDSGKSHP